MIKAKGCVEVILSNLIKDKIMISDDMIMICHQPAYIILLDDSMTAQHVRLRYYDTICSIDSLGLFTYIWILVVYNVGNRADQTTP